MQMRAFFRTALAAVLLSVIVAGCAGRDTSKDSGSTSPVKQTQPGSGTRQAEPGSGTR